MECGVKLSTKVVETPFQKSKTTKSTDQTVECFGAEIENNVVANKVCVAGVAFMGVSQMYCILWD